MSDTQIIDDLKAQIATLQEELRLARQRSEFCCPLCGSNLTKSTINNRFFCKQDNGLCGELRLGYKKRTPYNFCHFTRTMVQGNGELFYLWQNQDDRKDLVVHKFFIAGIEVEEDRYKRVSENVTSV